jgi:hypothetical protein
MIVKKLTAEQAQSLYGQTFANDAYFNPIQDVNDNWVISMQESDGCNHAEFAWVKDLPEILFMPKRFVM